MKQQHLAGYHQAAHESLLAALVRASKRASERENMGNAVSLCKQVNACVRVLILLPNCVYVCAF